MTGAWPRESVGRIALSLHGHEVPVLRLPLVVGDRDGDGRSEGPSVTDAAQDVEGIGLQALPPTASVPVATPSELTRDLLGSHGHGRRHPFEDGRQRLPVRLPGGEHPEHGSIVSDPIAPT